MRAEFMRVMMPACAMSLSLVAINFQDVFPSNGWLEIDWLM